MKSELFNDFESSLKTFLNSVVKDMNDKKSIEPDTLLNVWHNHNTNITSKVIELMFDLVEGHDIDQNSIKASEKGLHTEILNICSVKAKNMFDKVFKDEIKPILYRSFSHWKS